MPTPSKRPAACLAALLGQGKNRRKTTLGSQDALESTILSQSRLHLKLYSYQITSLIKDHF